MWIVISDHVIDSYVILDVDRLLAPRAPVVCGFGMGCACGMGSRATRAEGTFRSMRESYDVCVGAVRCKKVEWAGGVHDENPGIEPGAFGLAGCTYYHRADSRLAGYVYTDSVREGPMKKMDVSTGFHAGVPKVQGHGVLGLLGLDGKLRCLFRLLVPHMHVFGVGGLFRQKQVHRFLP